MLYNQNGYPKNNCNLCRDTAIKCLSNDAAESGNMTYSQASARLIDAPLAYVYSPNQQFRLLYSAPEALRHGTLFEELYKSMEVYGNE